MQPNTSPISTDTSLILPLTSCSINILMAKHHSSMPPSALCYQVNSVQGPETSSHLSRDIQHDTLQSANITHHI